ncbi:MAG: YkgJ family cysteine cluster protein [Betaproteobacteria bacterium]|nr:YkgJ family cysteine cluster protein [Betaproteobacteria bacterium]
MRKMLWKIRATRRFWYALERLPLFLAVTFSAHGGLLSARGRTLIWGKIRRFFLSLFPPLARFLREKHGLVGACSSCGASCNLLFQCPHWDDRSRLCSVYEDRPAVCRLFPITPSDIRDRDLVAHELGCGFSFESRPEQQPILVRIPLRRARQDVE